MQEWAFGDLLKTFRKQKRLSQLALAEKLGVHRNTIWSWEQGVYLPDSRGMVVELAKQLSLDDLQTRQLLEASLTAITSYWQVPFVRNPFFTGREDILAHLHNLLTRPSGCASLTCSCAVYGLGGVGKTQLVVEYAYRHRYDYEAVLWVQAETQDALVSSFVALAQLLALPEQSADDQSKLVASVLRWLNGHKGWLLIFDNVEDTCLLKPFLPATGQGALLLTTRLHYVGSLALTLELPPLSGEEGMRFLLHRARLNPSSSSKHLSAEQLVAAQTLVEMMDGLPLALDQAGAYVERTGCRLTDYLRMYQSNQSQLLGERCDRIDHPQSVVKTLLFSFLQLAQVNEAAADLLRLCAFLAPDAIPEDLFIRGATSLGPLLGSAVTDVYQFNRVLGEAFHYSLLHRQPELHTLSVHRLVQVVLKDSMDEPTARLWAGRAAAAVATCVALEGDKHAGERDCRYLLHARSVLQHIQQWSEWKEPAVLVPIWYYVGLVAEQYGQTSEARDAYLQGLEIVRRFPHPLEAALLVHVGCMVSDLGDDQQALAYQQQGAQRARQINDKNTLGFALLSQGQIQDNLGHYQLAATTYQEGLAVSLETQDWAMVSAFLQNLGVQAGRRGDYEQAKSLYHEGLAYARQSQQLLPQSSLLMNLGMLAVLQEQYDQALTYTLESLDLARQIHHRYMIVSISQNLGIIYRLLGQLPQAQSYLDESLRLAHELQNCWVIAETQGEYGWLLLEQEQPDEAREMFACMLAGARQIQASELIARALFGLAHVAARQHCWEQARSLALESLERFTLLGDAHSKRVSQWLATLPGEVA
jgi:tetratricopeptide (TPR) repeat protein/transcriptional regulator with XRE-family HTH domain